MAKDSTVLLNFIECLSITGLIILLVRLFSSLYKTSGSSKLSKTSLVQALRSEFNKETVKADVERGIFLACVAFVVSLITEFNSVIVLLLLSHFLWLFRKKEYSPAVGLAWSYYFGYLKIVLPRFVENSNNSRHKDFLLKKLFILVPANCKVYDRLNNADPNLEYAENLSAIKEDVAGIHVRKYVNTLYHVTVGGEKFFAAIEYATPLKTLQCMSEHKEAGLSRPERDRQAVLFLETITNILKYHADPPEIKDRVEFIYLEEGMSISNEISKAVLSSRSF